MGYSPCGLIRPATRKRRPKAKNTPVEPWYSPMVSTNEPFSPEGEIEAAGRIAVGLKRLFTRWRMRR